MNTVFREIIEDCPVIATVKDSESLEKSFETDSHIIFILFGDICNISEIVERVKEKKRVAMVHLDLVSGFDGSVGVNTVYIQYGKFRLSFEVTVGE